ncbi:GNAT family N-acetyltransferase [Cellulosimicrobium marinum]|uniref:GNAT family N-acetyltransferase n=1 Tax=Cellulosimicrobium marinum TaxID=1638992 RepID=UPI001E3DBCB8|nr:GNAT family N-acetyltransferase [Cellulosimicrobium marinum]MCB7137482.1 acetyltransferase [Cellulosimicrobium marinum]
MTAEPTRTSTTDGAPDDVVTGWLPTGAPGELLRAHDLPGGGRVTVRVLDPDLDLDVLHAWVTQPRARFWGLGELSRTELRDLYAYVGSLATHHAFLVRWDEEPVVLLQTYEPAHDPVGEAYAVLPGDVGMHLFLGGRGPRGTHLWGVLGAVLVDFLFADERVRRVVVEPDVANALAHGRMRAMGFETTEPVRVGEKDALLAFLTRERAAGALAAAPFPVAPLT